MKILDKTEFTKIKKIILDNLDDNKALDIKVIDLHENNDIAYYIIIASGTSSRHISSLGENIAQEVKKYDAHIPVKMEGIARSSWFLIDIGGIIVHIFQPDAREKYNIEVIYDRSKKYRESKESD